MRNPLLTTFRQAGLFMQTVTGTILVTFTMLVLAPTAVAAQAEIKKAKQEALLAPTEEDELSKTVVDIDEKLERVKQKLAARQDAKADKDELKLLRKKAEALDKGVMEHFDEVEKHIKAKNLDPIILQRHQDAVAQYKKDMATMLSNLRYTESAPNETEFKKRLDSTGKHLKLRKHKRAQQPFDPNNLPNQNLAPTKEKPKKKKEEFTRAGLFDTPYAKYVALGDFRYDTLVGASDPAYLAETVEVKMTQAVKDKAAELNHDPVKIYHWVLNNVDWIPTWGSMQDADHTLSSKRGNAMDIASLTIALLRASGIPARYVHGTIEVTEDKFRNWTGGFENIEAAANFTSSGGIPTAGVVSGGKITKVQMEHIWVEAAIDYQPSRGAVNRDADTWVEMDPSYKQYEFLPGLDVAAISGVDGQTLAQQVANGSTVNEQEGWMQGFDPTILQNAQTQIKQAIEEHVAQMQGTTMREVIGGGMVIVKEFPVLPSALMNKVIVKGSRYSSLPSSLQHKVTFALGYDPYASVSGTTSEISLALAQVNSRKVTISFKPATAADEQALLSLLPDGEITDPNQMPSSIPAYLAKVLPELRVEGRVVLTGSTAMTLGTDFEFRYATEVVNHRTYWYSSVIPAGSYYAVGVGGGSVAPERLASLKTKLEATKLALEKRDATYMAGLSRDDLMGDAFYSASLMFGAEYQAIVNTAALQHRAREIVAPSIGVYGYKPKVAYFWGSPRSVSMGGIELDLPGLKSYNAMLNGDRQQLIAFRFHNGLLSSALEHAIPEQMFSTSENPGEGVSAVKALGKAAQEGQRIYYITQANAATALQNIRLDAGARAEITAAVESGKTVVTHTDPISVPGWSGAGYIVFDTETGDGAYKISGGANGGWYTLLAVATGAVLLAVVGAWALYASAGFVIALMALFALTAVLALVNGVDYQAYSPSINYIEFITMSLGMLSGLAYLATWVGAAFFVPWLLAIFTIGVIIGAVYVAMQEQG